MRRYHRYHLFATAVAILFAAGISPELSCGSDQPRHETDPESSVSAPGVVPFPIPAAIETLQQQDPAERSSDRITRTGRVPLRERLKARREQNREGRTATETAQEKAGSRGKILGERVSEWWKRLESVLQRSQEGPRGSLDLPADPSSAPHEFQGFSAAPPIVPPPQTLFPKKSGRAENGRSPAQPMASGPELVIPGSVDRAENSDQRPDFASSSKQVPLEKVPSSEETQDREEGIPSKTQKPTLDNKAEESQAEEMQSSSAGPPQKKGGGWLAGMAQLFGNSSHTNNANSGTSREGTSRPEGIPSYQSRVSNSATVGKSNEKGPSGKRSLADIRREILARQQDNQNR